MSILLPTTALYGQVGHGFWRCQCVAMWRFLSAPAAAGRPLYSQRATSLKGRELYPRFSRTIRLTQVKVKTTHRSNSGAP